MPAPPSVPSAPLAPALEETFPMAGTPVLNFSAMLQNVAAAHEQEIGQLREIIKSLQAGQIQKKHTDGVELSEQNNNGGWRPMNDLGKNHPPFTNDQIPSTNDAQGRLEEAPDSPKLQEELKASKTEFSNHTVQMSEEWSAKKKKILKSKKSVLEKVLDGPRVSPLKAFLNGPFDAFIGILVVLNAVVMFIEYEYEGYMAAVHLGITSDDGKWKGVDDVFRTISHVFNIIFLLELFFRLALSRRDFFFDPLRGHPQYLALFDAVVVLMTSIDMYLIQPLLGSTADVNTSVFRLIRLARVTRALRAVRVMYLFSKLRVMVKAIAGSVMTLFWAMVLMGVLIFIGSLLICRFVGPFLMDDSIPIERRMWMHEYYGTSGSAIYTMFEVTFAGCWPTYARPLVTEISGWFVLFWFFYIVVVVFAVTRVITALFLKDTMTEMQNDIEMIIASRIMQRDAYVAKLRDMFKVADSSGDGKLTVEELSLVLKNPRVVHMFASLDLEIHEVWSLYSLLEDDGDGVITYEEFLRGVIRLKGQARSLDVVALGRDCEHIMKKAHTLEMAVARLEDTSASHGEALHRLHAHHGISKRLSMRGSK